MQKQNIKSFLWGAGAGGVALAIVLFATGFAVTSSNAQQQARVSAQSALTEGLAKICVAQFEVATDKADKLAKMKDLNSWDRISYVRDQGWATMPGSENSSGPVATECALRLVEATG